MGSSVSSRSALPPNGPAGRLEGRISRPPAGKAAGCGPWSAGWFAACWARVGNPPIALVLWNGEAIGHAAPKARLKIHDRRTFWQLLANVYLNFGDAFSDGRVEVEGDLLEFLEIIYRSEDAQPRRRPGGGPGRVAAQAAGQHARRLAIEHPSPLRHRRRLLSPLARSGDGLHLRLLSFARGFAGRSAGGQDGPGLPQALAQAGRDGGRGGLRLGGAGAVHGAALRRHGEGL